MAAATAFIHEPDPDHPGWHRWDMEDQTRFNPQVMGAMRVRVEAPDTARLRMEPQAHHANAIGGLHGGAILGLIDIALFAAAHTLTSANAAGSVTLDLDCRFIDAGTIGPPVDAVTQMLRETGRFAFMRGLVEQDARLLASFSGTVRKPARR